MANVTIAIVSWNTRELLERCLDSLAPEHEAGRGDVWVVDNASDDGSAELVRERFSWANLIASSENLGFGPAVNVVAERTTSDWVAPANADIRLRPGALERMLAAGAAPRVGAVAPRLILPDGSIQRSVFPFPTLPLTALNAVGLAGPRGPFRQNWRVAGAWTGDRAADVAWAVGAFMIVRRTAWDEVGGFDPAQWMYAEDLDLGWRLHRSGWRTLYEPAAIVDHDESAAATKAWAGERFLRWHRSTYAWMLRRRGPARTRAIAAVNVAGYGLKAALLTPGAAIGVESWRNRRRAAVNAARAHRTGLAPRAQLEASR